LAPDVTTVFFFFNQE